MRSSMGTCVLFKFNYNILLGAGRTRHYCPRTHTHTHAHLSVHTYTASYVLAHIGCECKRERHTISAAYPPPHPPNRHCDLFVRNASHAIANTQPIDLGWSPPLSHLYLANAAKYSTYPAGIIPILCMAGRQGLVLLLNGRPTPGLAVVCCSYLHLWSFELQH